MLNFILQIIPTTIIIEQFGWNITIFPFEYIKFNPPKYLFSTKLQPIIVLNYTIYRPFVKCWVAVLAWKITLIPGNLVVQPIQFFTRKCTWNASTIQECKYLSQIRSYSVGKVMINIFLHAPFIDYFCTLYYTAQQVQTLQLNI